MFRCMHWGHGRFGHGRFSHDPSDQDACREFMGRHHGGRGFGRFSGGFMGPPGFRGGDFRTGRKLAAADLQLIILALLKEKPRYGYELIKAFEERSNGFYSPSPGMIYPALTYLEELGHARVEAEGTRKLYHVTEEGLRHLEQNRAVADSILTQLEHVGRKMDRVRRAFAEDGGEDETDAPGVGGDPEMSGRGSRVRGFQDMWRAHRDLDIAIRENKHGSMADHKRVAAILRKAAAEIRALQSGASEDGTPGQSGPGE